MGMNIESGRIEQLARQLAEQTGKSLTDAIEQALDGELQRLRKDASYEERKARVKEIIRRSGPTPPGLTSDHSDLYDEIGLPK